MAFNTKIKIDDQHVEQDVGTTFTLSGNTRYGEHPTFTGDTQIVDKKYVDDNIISGVTSGSTYDLGSPAAVEVGGITVGTVLTGKSSNCLLEEMLYPELCGTLTAPSMTSLVVTPGTSPREIGTICNLTITASFSRGSINPQYCSASPFRSGVANSYCFTGAGTNGSQACTLSTAVTAITSHVITSGANTWGSCTSFDEGCQPKSNKDINFDSPYGANTTGAKTDTISGILPWFWGTGVTSTILADDITGGTKVLGNVTSSTPITFEVVSPATGYLWFAAPACAAAKTKWWVCAANAGDIGGVGNAWAASCNVDVTSPDGCWASCTFEVYVTCGTTSTAAGVPMCLYVG